MLRQDRSGRRWEPTPNDPQATVAAGHGSAA